MAETAGLTKASLAGFVRQITVDVPKRHGAANRFALGIVGVAVMKQSQRIVPHEFGPLANSARSYVTDSKRLGGFGDEARVFYSADYAAAVHERVEMVLKGQPRPSGFGEYWDAYSGPGSAKFLERVVREERRGLRVLYVRAFRTYVLRMRRAARPAGKQETPLSASPV